MPAAAASRSASPPRLSLHTLGEAGLFAEGTPVPVLGPGKPFALLVYLAVSPGRRASREFLLDLLWADLDPDRARRALRQALFHLRRLLGEETLAGTEELTLSSTIEVDRDAFLRDLDLGLLEEAAQHYVGNFLPEFGVPGGAAFEQWADLERDRMQRAYLRTADLLVRRQLNASRFRDAQRLARRTRDLVPHDERAWRLVLEAAIAGQDFIGAAVEAEALLRWADVEGRTLEPLTHSTIARAHGVVPRSEDPAASGGLMVELTGREREFSAITSAWEACRSASARHLHLTAPAGFGKSRLLRDACARLTAGGALVVQLHGRPGDREVPYAFAGDLASVIASLPGSAGIAPASAATLVALNPSLSSRFTVLVDSTQGEEALRRRIHALGDLLHAVADEQPFVLAIDDLHWIDRSSYRVLEGLFSRLEGAHLLCLTAARPERQPADAGCSILPLAALSREQLASLVSALGVLPDDEEWSRDFVNGLQRATKGSPLLVLETLRLALDGGVLSLERSEWQCHQPDRLHTLLQTGEALRERVRALPPAEAWLLALLATAGTPIDLDRLVGATGDDSIILNSGLDPLEHQGFVAAAGPLWSVAHDEIAAAASEALPRDQLAQAHRVIGRYFSQAADADSLLRAARHFDAAGDEATVRVLHRQYARSARDRGDRRRFAEIAAEFVGDEPGSRRASALARGLPLSWRLGLWSAPRQVAALITGLMVPMAAMGFVGSQRAEEAHLQRLVYSDSTGAITSTPMRLAEWDGSGGSLAPTTFHSAMAAAALRYTDLPPAISPDGKSVAWIEDMGDSTTLDIWLRTPSGTRRLTRQAHDDLVQGWLPDGSALIGQSMRWSPGNSPDYDIAVFDTASGDARQVTRGPAEDRSPFVSPDGTRVAFIRSPTDGPPRLCVTTIDGGREPECRLIAGRPIAWLLGWIGLDELVLTTDDGNSRPLIRYDWQRDAITPLLGPQVYRARLSRDGRWVMAAARLEGIDGFRDVVFPITDPGKVRVVAGPGNDRNAVRWWEGEPDHSLFIDHLDFSDSVREILPGIGTRLSIRAITATGREVPVRAPVAWRSSDTLIATIDSMGEMRVQSAGIVRVTATLAGWRSVSKEVRVEALPPATVLDERWDAGWLSRWLPWGDPLPIVTTGPGRIAALWNHGDGTYPSMALLRQGLSARDGLGLEARLSTPADGAPHQRLKVVILAGLDIPAFEAADRHRAPPSMGATEAACGIVFPGENRWELDRIAVRGGMSELMDLATTARRLRNGGWWTLRLQILPDGRCGIAVNDSVLWLSPERIPLNATYHVWLGDESAGTRLLVGPLRIWTGVRTDLRWGAAAR